MRAESNLIDFEGKKIKETKKCQPLPIVLGWTLVGDNDVQVKANKAAQLAKIGVLYEHTYRSYNNLAKTQELIKLAIASRSSMQRLVFY